MLRRLLCRLGLHARGVRHSWRERRGAWLGVAMCPRCGEWLRTGERF